MKFSMVGLLKCLTDTIIVVIKTPLSITLLLAFSTGYSNVFWDGHFLRSAVTISGSPSSFFPGAKLCKSDLKRILKFSLSLCVSVVKMF